MTDNPLFSQSRMSWASMNPVQNAIFCAKVKLCVLAVLIVLITIILAISLSAKDKTAEENLKFADEKLDFPKRYRVVRALDSYTETTFFSTGGERIGHAKKCFSCEATWTIYLLNKRNEIAVVVKKVSWPWGDMYDIEEQWKINATSFNMEYDWSGIGVPKEVYMVKNSNGDEIARSDRFLLEVDKTITLNDTKGKTLGVIERPAFELFPTWEISVSKTGVVPTYFYGVLATITTMKEIDNDNDD